MGKRRKAYLRAMERAVFGDRPVPRETLDLWRPGLVAALDEVEPLIRADEQERHGNNCAGMWDEWLTDLRVKVEALDKIWTAWDDDVRQTPARDGDTGLTAFVKRDDVLALLNGSSDE